MQKKVVDVHLMDNLCAQKEVELDPFSPDDLYPLSPTRDWVEVVGRKRVN